MKRPIQSSVLAVALGVLCAAPVSAAEFTDTPRKSPECFYTSSINGWNYVGNNTVRVSVGASRSYDLKLMGYAHDLDFKETLGVKAGPSGWICEGNGLGVEVFSRGPLNYRWPVTSITRVQKPHK